MKYYLRLLISVGLLLLAGMQACKKDDKTNIVDVKPNLSLTKSEYQPYELAVLEADKSFTLSQYLNATINSETVSAFYIDETHLGFLVPSIPSGSYTLELQSDLFNNKSFTVVVGTYTTITNPDQQINDFISNIVNRQSELNSLQSNPDWAIDVQNLAEIEAMKTSFQQAISTATQQEKEQLAYFLKANNFLSTSFEDISFVDSFYLRKLGGPDIDPGDELDKVGRSFVSTMLLSFTTASILGGLINVPEFSVTKFGALTAGISLGLELIYAKSLIDRLGNCIGKAADFNITGSTTFTIGKSIDFIDKIEYRNLLDADFSENNYIKTIVAKSRLFERYWNNLETGLNKIKSWFIGIPDKLSGTATKLKSSPTFKQFQALSDYISIENISNSSISLNIVEVNGEKKIRLSGNITQSFDFTFDMVYKHPSLGNVVRKKVNANVDACFNSDLAIGSISYQFDSNMNMDVITINATGGVPPYNIEFWQSDGCVNIGCGSVSCGRKTANSFWVCNYDPLYPYPYKVVTITDSKNCTVRRTW